MSLLSGRSPPDYHPSFTSGVSAAPSKTYQRPAPLKHKQHSSSESRASFASSPYYYSRLDSKPTTNVLDVSRLSSKYAASNRNVTSPYKRVYTRLGPGEIRLLWLEPSKDQHAAIRGSLVRVRLTPSTPSYTAVSYAWGSRREMSSIDINGEAISITISLWHALAAIRSTDQAILIWADALSINQHDVHELNYQVQIMDTIYSKAEIVAICLGPHSEDGTSRLALPYLREILSPGCPPKIDCIESKEQISAVVHLFERSYWKRLWIMQEVFHAKKAVVYCGSDSITLGDISIACKYFALNSHRIDNGFPSGKGVQKSTNHYSFAQTLTTQGPNALLDPSTDLMSTPLHILRLCRNKLAARPQDKILGALSLLPEAIRVNFQPDFHHTPQEVFTEIVTCVVKQTWNLDIICESIRYPFHQDSLGLPSWVPDWSHAPDTLSLAATHLSHRPPFEAWPVGIFQHVHKLPLFNKDTLQIHALQIGTITTRGMAVGTLGRLSNYLMAFLEWRNLLLDEFDDGRKEKSAFCRTLCLGDIPEDVCKTLKASYGSEWSPATSLKPSDQWQQVTFDLFAGYLAKRLGKLPLDAELQSHQKAGNAISEGRQFLQEYFGDRMMGRCFCVLRDEGGKKYMGMGTGYMGIDDLVVVAYGCSTPIVIRPTGQQGQYEFIGDIYVDGFMDGEVLDPGFSGIGRNFNLC